MNFNALQSDVQAVLPRGYTATDSTGGTTIVSTEILACKSAVLDNRTALQNVAVAMVIVPVAAPAEVAAGNGTDLYLLDFVANNDEFCSRVNKLGFACAVGMVTTDFSTTPLSIDVTSSGLHYSISLVGQQPRTAPAVGAKYRYHFHAGTETWMDYAPTEWIGTTTLVGELMHTGGSLDKVSRPSIDPVTSTLYQGMTTIDFQP